MAFTAEQIDEFVKLCAQQNPDPLEKMQIDFVKDGTTVSKQDLATLLLAHMESKGRYDHEPLTEQEAVTALEEI